MVNLDLAGSENIWVASSDGDLERVKKLIEAGVPPNIADDNSYTPMHAAASWGRQDVLRYLNSQGGNINITDEDGDTPLFSVEDLETAKLVIELGGDPLHANDEGLTADECLGEEYPEISNYLRGLIGKPLIEVSSADAETDQQQSEPSKTDPTQHMTTNLLGMVQEIMTEAETNGISSDSPELDRRLREAVTQTVDQSADFGRLIASRGVDVLQPSIGANTLEMVVEGEETAETASSSEEASTTKRQRI
ncbi:hypothetical protein O181_009996 [Austropuccinia psidii MF-1]|uniref:Uncharacterized protein n=1 Tax=Austropuccinia psidii MF-1 TaxID=1389203 RepID=A0A9Q3BQ79_9BASI|nr:hypothetical protein [Austropuccinia psidii MF-1]